MIKWNNPNIILLILFNLFSNSYGQHITQTVRGKVVDSDTKTPLSYANIMIKTTNPVLGAASDMKGVFRIDQVPIGRHDIQVSYMGYETKVIPEILVSSGKEVVLEVSLKEDIVKMDAMVVTAYTKKDKPINSMATVSARTFSVEEGRRYAGGFDDPGRLVASFSGVTTENTRDNTIIIRGNSPKGLLWRLEGVEISNPNHFANLGTFGGGGISALSALVMGNSDFFTGAFPAEYGNAMSGVFDINLRTGNNENHEHAVQLGTLGLDIASEGPLGKNSRASYLFNYRYSTMGLVKEIFPEDVKDFLPVYQDLSFKINMPTQKAGIFSVWGLASEDILSEKAETDSSLWEMAEDRQDFDVIQQVMGLGLNHRYIMGEKAYLKTSFAITGDYMKLKGRMLGYDLKRYEKEYTDNRNYKFTLTSVYNHKFSARHTNRTGFILDKIHYNTILKHAPILEQGIITVADEDGSSYLFQGYSQSKFWISKRLVLNAGFHYQHFDLSSESVFEPRVGLSFNLRKAQTISLAYGKHSRLEQLMIYFAKVNENGVGHQPNKDLKITKAHHLVLGYDLSINPNLRLKIEPYIQHLYDVPVIPDSNYSVLNMEVDWYFQNKFINTGTGRNVGLDITLERFLHNGYYYLFTLSLLDSKYKGADGVERNTRFNSRYVCNLIYGKEWTLGKQKNKILGVNLKMNFFGGWRTTPVNEFESNLIRDVVLYNDRLYEGKDSDRFYTGITINYRINKRNYSSILSLQMMNVFLAKENYGLIYNYKKNQVERWEFAVPVPSLGYKIEF